MSTPATDPLDVLAIGEPLVELTAEETGRLGDVSRFRRGWGGDTSNLVIAAARQGARCGYLTRVGDDEFGRSFLELWQRENLDTSAVAVVEGACTGVYFVARGGHGERQFTYYRSGSAASGLAAGTVTARHVDRARIVHASGISQAVSSGAAAAIRQAFSLARRAGAAVSYDANVRPNLAALDTLLATFEDTLPSVDVLFLSEHDARLLYPDRAPLSTLRRLAERGPEIAVLTRGAAGCTVYTAEPGPVAVPAWPVPAVDTTAAGDALAGAFLAARARGATPEEAARLGNAAAALSTTALGAVDSLPRAADVERLLRGDAPFPSEPPMK